MPVNMSRPQNPGAGGPGGGPSINSPLLLGSSLLPFMTWPPRGLRQSAKYTPSKRLPIPKFALAERTYLG
jgi:hypothetical protein